MSTLKKQALGWLTIQPSTWLGELHQERKRPFRMRKVEAEGLDSWAFTSSPTSSALSQPLFFLPSFMTSPLTTALTPRPLSCCLLLCFLTAGLLLRMVGAD